MIVDTNVTLGLWPFRRIPGDTVTELVKRLRRRGVAQAWTGSFDGAFHRDLTAANARLTKACASAGEGFLLPFGTVNPGEPGWREDLRLCHEVHRMRGIRLHPNYHRYSFSDTSFSDCLRAARERKLIVQVTVSLEDERVQHPLMRVAPVDTAPLASILRSVPGTRMILLNRARNPSGEALTELMESGEVYVDIATIEGVGCAGQLMEQTSEKRIVFGSHSPFQYFESALLKLEESGIAGDKRTAILSGNARSLLARQL